MTQRKFQLRLSWRVSLLIAVLLLASAFVTTAYTFRQIQSTELEQSKEAQSNVHMAMTAAIQAEYASIQLYRNEAIMRRKEQMSNVAEPLIVMFDELRTAVDDGDLTKKQAQTIALQSMKTLRYGNNDYFFTYDYKLNAIEHPDARFDGKNLSNLTDADGNFIIRQLRDIALSQGSGYLEYNWERLDGATPSPKIGYVIDYTPWKWIIGTGVYVDDIDAEVQARVQQIRSSISNTFKGVNFADDGVFFVMNREGQIVAAPSPEVKATAATPDGQEVLKSIVANAPTVPGEQVDQHFDVKWSEDEEQEWLIRSTTIGGDLDWILVSAVPTDNLKAPGRELAIQLLILSGIVLLIGLAIGLLVSRRITKPVDDITRAAAALADDSFDPSTLTKAASRTDEVGTLARTFQRMGSEVIERERKLREQVERLTVRIDHEKVQEDVQEITESEYFQNLKSRAAKLRDDEQSP